MDRTNVNPWEWSKTFGFSQAVEVRGAERILVCSGRPVSKRMVAAFVLQHGRSGEEGLREPRCCPSDCGAPPSYVVKVNYYTTDVDELVTVLGPLVSEFCVDNLPASTLLGVARLAFPQLKIEVEATATR